MYVKHQFHPHPIPACEEAQSFARWLQFDAPRLSVLDKDLPPIAYIDDALFLYCGDRRDVYKELIQKFFRPERTDLIIRLELKGRKDLADTVWEWEADEALIPFVCLYHRLQAQS